jgi:hypothetical protein
VRVGGAQYLIREPLPHATASRITPDVETVGGTGRRHGVARPRVCRRRRQELPGARGGGDRSAEALDAATQTVAQAADPQPDSAARMMASLSGGMIKPTGDDFVMMRLILLALLPQLGGLLLMVGHAGR